MFRLLLASNNPGKLKEIRPLLAGLELELLTLQQVGVNLDIEEIGVTYAENATLKAHACARASGEVTLADDSGLEVYVLGGRPGIYSARFSKKPNATDADRRKALLEQLQVYPQPWKAHFHCTVAIATPEGDVYLFDGECHGEIIAEERGDSGFGYDPIFLITEIGRTMAELGMDEKNRISHRARAIQEASPLLTKLIIKAT